MKRLSHLLSLLMFCVLLSLPIQVKENKLSRTSIEINYADANPVFIIAGLVKAAHIAYRVYKSSKAVRSQRKIVKARRELIRKCEKLAKGYQSFKGALACKDTCAGVKIALRAACYQRLKGHIKRQLESMKAERTGRTAFERLCANPGVGRKKVGGRAKGGSWTRDEGHREQITVLKNAIGKCSSVLDLIHGRPSLMRNATPDVSS